MRRLRVIFPDRVGSDSKAGNSTRLHRVSRIAAVFVLIGTVLFSGGSSGAALDPSADTYGLVDPATGIWHLYKGDQEVTQFYYGNPGDYPFMGDWDCDGADTPGLYRQSDGYAYLRNANSPGIADVSFYFGNPGDIPIVGDFNADGCDTVSIYRPSNQTFFIINELGTNDGGLGAAEYSFIFGDPGDKPFIGDFNGNGQDTVGLHRESTGLVYYRNTNTQGIADNTFIYGDPGDRFVAGDWTGNGVDAPGLFRPSNTTMYLRYENSQGNADEAWMVGTAGWIPVAGWFLVPVPAPTPDQGSIAGAVTEEGTGTPLPGINVAVVDYAGGDVFYWSATTAADGTYEVLGLDSGDYDVHFEDDAAVYVDEAVFNVQVNPGATTIVNAQQVSWAVANNASITGFVTDRGTGTPLAGISVRAETEGDYPRYKSTAADGSYEFSGLDPGVYWVLFEDNALVYVDKGVNNVQVEPAVTATVNIQLVSWEVFNRGSIAGVVRAEGTGTPLPGITVEVVNTSNSATLSTASAVDGTYEIDDLPEGTYDVHFADPLSVYADLTVSGVSIKGTYKGVNIELALEPGPIDVEALVTRYAPELRFHPDEQFYLANPVDVLDRSNLTYGWVFQETSYWNYEFLETTRDPTSAATLVSDVDKMLATGVLDDPGGTLGSLGYVPRYFIEIPADLKAGNLSEAVVNVRVLPVGDYLDLQYWFFYPYNGHGWSWVRFGPRWTKVWIPVPPENAVHDSQIGRHWGDWEHATVRLLADTLELQSVYLSRHSGGQWYTPDEVEFVDGTHPIVYPGKFTHANYLDVGSNRYRRQENRYLYGVDLFDYTRDGGANFQAWQPGATEIFSSALPGFAIKEPEWLKFEKRWGQYIKNRLAVCFAKKQSMCVGQLEVNGGPSGPAMKDAWTKGDVNEDP